MNKSNRDSIQVFDCQILAHYQFEGNQYILTIDSPEIAKATKPGQFVHLTVSDALAMRRPISIMSVDSRK
jgi:dihydroorotate oxidase B, electron transfer subunit (EC 1.3.3.1)